MLNISFGVSDLLSSEATAVLVNSNERLPKEIMDLDHHLHGLIGKFLSKKEKAELKPGSCFALSGVSKDDGTAKIIILAGAASDKPLSEAQIEAIGASIHNHAKTNWCKTVNVILPDQIDFSCDKNEASAMMASGAMLAAYKFDKYLTKQTAHEKFAVEHFTLDASDPHKTDKIFEKYKAIILGVYFARDLVSEAPNILYPESYADQVLEKMSDIGIDVNVLGENEMRDLGMGALLGVGQGSARESKMVVMEYYGGEEGAKPICFVGKGVTFDTGGISIKPADGMGYMKYDMAGSAAVVGAIYALALRGAKVNAVGVIGLVENMPGGNAQRPGDIVTTMSGQTVEILNTDAEGRLVLCDCMTYVQKNFQPECIIDLATLTGAIIVSLASTYAGMFVNDDELSQKLIKAGEEVGEKLWRMPLHKDYDEMLKSPVADMANIGGEKGSAGSCTAAHFVGRFIEDGIKWAHLDIAGMAWNRNGKNPICPKGGVGFGVRLLNKFVQDNYESR
jgi:leucyl aminopeptidase